MAAPQLEFGNSLSEWKAASGDAALEADLQTTESADSSKASGKLPLLSKAPVIDGKLDEECWKNAWKAPVFLNGNGTEAEVPMEAWLACDNNYIYAAFQCQEPDSGRFKDLKPAKNKTECYKPDSVEVFIVPGIDNEYLHIAVNPSGSLDEEWSKATGWTSGAEKAVVAGDKEWTVELAIPFANMRKGGTDVSRWSVNLCRTRISGDRKEYSSCSGGKNFHETSKYIKVSGIPSKINIWSFESAKILTEGDKSQKLFVCVNSPYENAGKKFRAILKISDKTIEKEFVINKKYTPLVFTGLPEELAPDSDAEIQIYPEGQNKSIAKFAGKVFYLTGVYKPNSPVKILAEYSWYPEGEKTARVKVGTSMPGKSSVKISLLNGLKTVFSRDCALNGSEDKIIEVPLTCSGELRAELVQNGETLGYAGDNIKILPPKKNSTRLNRFTR